MLYQMKSRQHRDAAIWDILQSLNRVRLPHRQRQSLRSCKHVGIKVYALSLKTLFYQQLQPFSATATQIKRFGLWVTLSHRKNERQVDLQAPNDVVSLATMKVFKGPIKIVAHVSIRSVGLSQATPTNSF